MLARNKLWWSVWSDCLLVGRYHANVWRGVYRVGMPESEGGAAVTYLVPVRVPLCLPIDHLHFVGTVDRAGVYLCHHDVNPLTLRELCLVFFIPRSDPMF